MRFTAAQYDQAIHDMELAKAQLEPDGNPCAICSGSDHMAWECRFNPLLSVAINIRSHEAVHSLHDAMHELAGFYASPMVARVCVLPDAECV